jgi:hypothetical protein
MAVRKHNALIYHHYHHRHHECNQGSGLKNCSFKAQGVLGFSIFSSVLPIALIYSGFNLIISML